jgi:hypothetical protein
MDRAERRVRTNRIAVRRLRSLCDLMRNGQPVGRFRKWNMTCRCKWCLIAKQDEAKAQLAKDERRNPLPEDQDGCGVA